MRIIFCTVNSHVMNLPHNLSNNSHNILRRRLLFHTLPASTVQLLVATGIILPSVFSLTRSENTALKDNRFILPAAFKANTVKQVFNELNIPNISSNTNALTSHKIILTAPEIAENGASVSIGMVSELPNTTDMYVLVAKNPNPLAASISFAEGMVPELRLFIRINETSPVHAVVKSNGQFYATIRTVQVTVGGCAG